MFSRLVSTLGLAQNNTSSDNVEQGESEQENARMSSPSPPSSSAGNASNDRFPKYSPELGRFLNPSESGSRSRAGSSAAHRGQRQFMIWKDSDHASYPSPIYASNQVTRHSAAQSQAPTSFRGGRIGGGSRGWRYAENENSDDGSDVDTAMQMEVQVDNRLPIITLVRPGDLIERKWDPNNNAGQGFWNEVADFFPYRKALEPLSIVVLAVEGQIGKYREGEEIPMDKILQKFKVLPKKWLLVPCFREFRLTNGTTKDRLHLTFPLVEDPIADDDVLNRLLATVHGYLDQMFPAEAYPRPTKGPAFQYMPGGSQMRTQEFKPLTQSAKDLFWTIIVPGILVQPYGWIAPKSGAMVYSDQDTCNVHHCHANLQAMSEVQLGEHHDMHKRTAKAIQRKHHLKDRNVRKKDRILRLHKQIPRYRYLVNKLEQDFQSLQEEALTELRQGNEQMGDKIVTAPPTQHSNQPPTSPPGQTSGALAKQATALSARNPPSTSPGTLPYDIAKKAAEINVYDVNAYGDNDLRPLLMQGYRYCNICLQYMKGYKDFKKHARECGTTPWNFVNVQKKNDLPASSSFSVRFSPSAGAVEQAASASRLRPQKRRRNSQQAYRYEREEEPAEEFEDNGSRAKKQKLGQVQRG